MASEPVKSKILSLGESLTIFHISEIKETVVKALSGQESLTLDLCNIEECDTAGVQLLIAVLKYGQSKHKDVSVINTSASVNYEVEKLGFCPADIFI